MSANGTNNQQTNSGGLSSFFTFIVMVVIAVGIYSYFTKDENNNTDGNKNTTYKTSIGEIDYGSLIPEDVIKYNYNGMEYISSVENVKVQKETTEDKVNTAYCEFELKDSRITRKAYICMVCKKYDTGGWQLESWESFDDEVLTEWNEEESKKLVDKEIKSLGYQSLKINDMKTYEYNVDDTGYVTHYSDLSSESYEGNEIINKYTYQINENLNYLSLTGTMDLNAIIGFKYGTNYYTGKNSYPVSYYTKIETDTTKVNGKWDLDGTWYTETKNKKGIIEYKLTLNFSGTNSSSARWDATAIDDRSNNIHKGSGIIDLSDNVLVKEEYLAKENKKIFLTAGISEIQLQKNIDIDSYTSFTLLLSTNGIYVVDTYYDLKFEMKKTR